MTNAFFNDFNETQLPSNPDNNSLDQLDSGIYKAKILKVFGVTFEGSKKKQMDIVTSINGVERTLKLVAVNNEGKVVDKNDRPLHESKVWRDLCSIVVGTTNPKELDISTEIREEYNFNEKKSENKERAVFNQFTGKEVYLAIIKCGFYLDDSQYPKYFNKINEVLSLEKKTPYEIEKDIPAKHWEVWEGKAKDKIFESNSGRLKEFTLKDQAYNNTSQSTSTISEMEVPF